MQRLERNDNHIFSRYLGVRNRFANGQKTSCKERKLNIIRGHFLDSIDINIDIKNQILIITI